MNRKIRHIQFGRLVITGHNTFTKKQFNILCNNDQLLFVNVFGFGLWVIHNSTPSEIKTMFRKVGADNEA